ncbi:tumor susceptibility gene 101 protein putative [Entamoeba histolytica]|uniref:Tumor susceptibility gene 101 protein, putative n=7 Tax=Entamoeba histolytica TaxID=5759 RepID=C4LUR9_ENTH1|nr:tumor susceptibility gene 101 protein, putative [Entamoeba histolytica HM-1:IMSS]EAL46661.2 tumor susceptibility gene 101 protein, putative [Entamoeba histolytica HM-1:IMSS]EMD49339.1 TSG101 domain containing protein, putative [Entamoeba histolytica KU27]ENY60391.1 hypothetical protein EHI7A_088170 [Entamoeba histolytica HM-1:IMSS-A]GAT92374.1 tumor susceptibility gene 101 protein putative [Entamoeba histolytica]|eukprot:XP_652049.2 tumor susceptibility gene 101 protein, putative [Entamoeba histolytica HM-1:IMSS]
MNLSKIDLTLSTVKPYYLYYLRVRVEITSVMQYYKFSATVRTYADGIILASLVGTIPIVYRGSQFCLPLCIMYPYDYPLSPPLFFTDPTPEMEVVPGHPYAMPNIVICHPILDRWSENVNTLSVLQVFVKDFSYMPPLRMKTSVIPSYSCYFPEWSSYYSYPQNYNQPIPLNHSHQLPSISSIYATESNPSIPPPQSQQLPSFQNTMDTLFTIDGFAPFKTKENECSQSPSHKKLFTKSSGPMITDLKAFVLGKQQHMKRSLPTISQTKKYKTRTTLTPLNTK